jgi:hypothetical protein
MMRTNNKTLDKKNTLLFDNVFLSVFYYTVHRQFISFLLCADKSNTKSTLRIVFKAKRSPKFIIGGCSEDEPLP